MDKTKNNKKDEVFFLLMELIESCLCEKCKYRVGATIRKAQNELMEIR